MKNNSRKRATAVIIKDGKILLFRRVKPDIEYYIFPGGGMEEGESIEQALEREIMEELSLSIRDFEPLCTVLGIEFPEYFNKHLTHKIIHDYYCFLVNRSVGTPELGGEEKASLSDDNQYHIEWIPMQKIRSMNNLYPTQVISPILEALSNK